mgnify:CR=1 FL=1
MYKVLQINVVGNFGSTGRIANDIGDLCLSNNWESYIGVGRKERPSNSKIIKIGNNIDLVKHALKTRVFDRHGFGSKKATKKFIEKILEIKPDIIHLHNIHGYFINIEILFDFLKEYNVPVVWTLHDCWAFTGHCAYFDFVKCLKWKTMCFACPQKKSFPSSCFFDNSKANYIDKKNLFNNVNNLTLVPVSNWLNGLVNDSFLESKSQVINNGVNLNDFTPSKNIEKTKAKLRIQNKLIVLGVASIWSDRKGFKDFIKLSKLVDKNVIIVLVGLNDKQFKNLPGNIIGIQRTESISELVDLYSAADLYLNLTYEDNFPTTNLEALACGTPVLTYNTGGSIESVDNTTGFVVKKGDIAGVVTILNKKGLFVSKKTKNSCREKALKNYNKDERYNEYLELYNRLIKNHKK